MVATQQESTVSTTWTMTHEEERSVASQKTDEDMENCREADWIPSNKQTVCHDIDGP